MDYLRTKVTIKKWMGKDTADRWLTFSIIVAMIVMIIACFSLESARGHDIHFSKMMETACPVVASGTVEDVGFVFGTDCDADGNIDNFYRVYKAGDLEHIGLHAEPLTKDTAAKILILQGLTQ